MKYKLIKDLPDAKAGQIVQFFGISYQEPYKSMIGERQYIPDVGWYWKDDIDRGKSTLKNFNIHCKCDYHVDTLPDWFTPCLHTSEEGEPIFEDTDVYFYEKGVLNHLGGSQISGKLKYFVNKENAIHYIESLKSKFKIGDVVVDTKYNRIGKIIELKLDSEPQPHVICENNITFILRDLKLANNSETIQYYEQQGWKYPTKFKIKETNIIYEFNSLLASDGLVCVTRLLDDGVYSEIYSYNIDDCKLIKKSSDFKIGDIVVWENIGTIGKIIELRDREVIVDNPVGQDIEYDAIRLADESEIIKYYTYKGWVKDAKFKPQYIYNGDNITINKLEFIDGILYIISNNKCKYEFDMCELIKESKYSTNKTNTTFTVYSYKQDLSKLCENTGFSWEIIQKKDITDQFDYQLDYTKIKLINTTTRSSLLIDIQYSLGSTNSSVFSINIIQDDTMYATQNNTKCINLLDTFIPINHKLKDLQSIDINNYYILIDKLLLLIQPHLISFIKSYISLNTLNFKNLVNNF